MYRQRYFRRRSQNKIYDEMTDLQKTPSISPTPPLMRWFSSDGISQILLSGRVYGCIDDIHREMPNKAADDILYAARYPILPPDINWRGGVYDFLLTMVPFVMHDFGHQEHRRPVIEGS